MGWEDLWGCTELNGAACGNQCTPGGHYCNPDPDQNLAQGKSGRDVIEEDLRQLCVWKQAFDSDAAKLWWTYVIDFATICRSSTFSEECSKSMHDKIPGLSWDATMKCVAKSWQPDNRNTLLDREILSRTERSILQLPSVVVNDMILRGGVSVESAFGAICSAFSHETKPQICNCVESGSSISNCIDSGKSSLSPTTASSITRTPSSTPVPISLTSNPSSAPALSFSEQMSIKCDLSDSLQGFYGRKNGTFTSFGIICSDRFGKQYVGPKMGIDYGTLFMKFCPKGSVIRRVQGTNGSCNKNREMSLIEIKFECIKKKAGKTERFWYKMNSDCTMDVFERVEFSCANQSFINGLELEKGESPTLARRINKISCSNIPRK